MIMDYNTDSGGDQIKDQIQFSKNRTFVTDIRLKSATEVIGVMVYNILGLS